MADSVWVVSLETYREPYDVQCVFATEAQATAFVDRQDNPGYFFVEKCAFWPAGTMPADAK